MLLKIVLGAIDDFGSFIWCYSVAKIYLESWVADFLKITIFSFLVETFKGSFTIRIYIYKRNVR